MCSTSVLCVYGAGGHHAQMNRLIDGILRESEDKIKFITLSDVSNKPTWSFAHYQVEELRSKHLKGILALIFIVKNSLLTFLKLITIFQSHDIKSVITTGPGLGLMSCIFFKLLRRKIIYLETWSRFDNKSISGKIMYKLADEFYYQNIELASIYPKGKYSGRL